MKGKLIIIEAGDGSGKETQARLLTERLAKDGYKVRQVEFPDYDADSSMLVRMYLRGDFGSHPDDVNPYAASVFFAVDRYASFMMKWKEDYEKGTIIVADRYTTSNMVHQAVKIKERSKRDAFLAWLYELEFQKMKLPAPTVVYFLDMAPEVSEKLLEERNKAKGMSSDIHECDREYLKRTHSAYNELATHYGWHRIISSRDGKPLPIADIHAKLYADVIKVISK